MKQPNSSKFEIQPNTVQAVMNRLTIRAKPTTENEQSQDPTDHQIASKQQSNDPSGTSNLKGAKSISDQTPNSQ